MPSLIRRVEDHRSDGAGPWYGDRAVVSLALALLLVCGLAVWMRTDRSFPSLSGGKRIMLAVLPFLDLRDPPSRDHLPESTLVELLSLLSSLDSEQVGVIAPKSALTYRSRYRGLDEVGRQLGADYVVDGSIRQAAGLTRVTVRLVRAGDQVQLWSETIERESLVGFELEEEIANRVTRSLYLTLPPRRRQGVSAEAVQRYRWGRFHWTRPTAEDLKKSQDFFRAALELEEGYVDAWVGLSESLSLAAVYGIEPPGSGFAEAERAARRALTLDPESPEAMAALAFAIVHRGGRQEALRLIEEALRRKPGRAVHHYWAATVYFANGRKADAFRSALEALRLDPLSLALNADVAWYGYLAEEYELAVSLAREITRRYPNRVQMARIIELSLYQLQRPNELIEEIRSELGKAQTSRRARQEFEAAAGKGLPGVVVWARRFFLDSARPGASSYMPAVLARIAGDDESALSWLDKAVENDEVWLVYLSADPILGPLLEGRKLPERLQRIAVAN